jgi:hypothetical protein
MTTIGDVVLIYREEEPAFFARIEDISADRKPDWYQVRLLVLQVPLQETSWILREEYINGEAFTIDNQSIRIEKVTGAELEEARSLPSKTNLRERSKPVDDNVISIFDRKRG